VQKGELMAPIDDVAAALNHQITDDEGKIIAEETASEETAPQEQTPVEETATAEKSEDEAIPPKEKATSENEPEMVPTAEDETGKRYVPEARFKEVYAKMKDLERRTAMSKVEEPVRTSGLKPSDKADALEIELLRTTLPQFNPESNDYSREVDELGYAIYMGSKDAKGNPTMTRIEAGRKALNMTKKITSKVVEIKSEARSVKAQQSDQGITNRVLNRDSNKIDPDKMTLEEKEEWLKAQGDW
jgi:hypothetical protein